MNHAQAVLRDAAAELMRLRPALRDITIAGELRRACELVSDLRLVGIDPGAAEVTRSDVKFAPLSLVPHLPSDDQERSLICTVRGEA